MNRTTEPSGTHLPLPQPLTRPLLRGLLRARALRARERLRRTLTGLVALPVHVYRLTGPVRQPRCRFLPTCSTYALDALQTHGPVRGAWLALRRIGRCHPWNLGGMDPVPPARAMGDASVRVPRGIQAGVEASSRSSSDPLAPAAGLTAVGRSAPHPNPSGDRHA